MENERKANVKLLIVGIVCVTILEGLALIKGVDGRLFSFAVGAICLLCGVTIPRLFNIRLK